MEPAKPPVDPARNPSPARVDGAIDSVITLEGLEKSFGPVRALDGVSLEIRPGITGLLGPNGAGKTTLIKILLGLVRATGGRGRVLGFEVGRQARAIRARVGYMPEDDCYIEGLPGVEMVAFSARLAGLPGVEALRRAHEILDFCGVEQERYRAVGTYSSGMRQKLKFAQAIVHDPPLLILDEPTATLDPEERQIMLQRVGLLARREGKSVLVSTHILPDVQQLCDHAIILAHGRVRLDESMEVLARPSAPAYHARVLGDPGPLVAHLGQGGIEAIVGNGGEITFPNSDADCPARVLAAAGATGVTIKKLVPARNSLEETFLEAVREPGTTTRGWGGPDAHP